MMRRFFTLLLLSLGVMSVVAQTAAVLDEGADIKFDSDLYNFGTVAEDGYVSCTFTFQNTGKWPLEIYKVTASCGCTTPSYSELPVAPGEKGTIEVTYNTEGRPGVFNKTITVYSNSRRHPTYSLSIRGTVTPRHHSPETLYPKVIGALRLKQTTVSMGRLLIGDIKNETIPLYNSNESQALHVKVTNVPAHIRVIVSNDEIPPAETAMLTLCYVTEKADDYGRREDFFHIETWVDGMERTVGSIQVTATLEEDFSALSGDDPLPAAYYEVDEIDFGQVVRGKKVSAEFEVKNNGSAPLVIRKLVNYASALTVKSDRREIAPGKKATVKVELDTEGLLSSVKYYIEVIANDPLMPRKRLTVTAAITE